MSKPSNFLEWIQLFERKSGQRFLLRHDYNLTLDSDGSFFQWKYFKGILFLAECAGDRNVWQRFIDEFCALNHVVVIVTYVRRNPRAFCKLFNAKVLYKYVDNCGTNVTCVYREVI